MIFAKRPDSKPLTTNAPSTLSEPVSSEHLLISRSPSTATIMLNNPRKGNILTASMVEHLRSLMAFLSSDPTTQTIIITNTGKYFCAGMDLSSSGPATSGSTKFQLHNLLSTFESVNSCPKTTIALINGSCFWRRSWPSILLRYMCRSWLESEICTIRSETRTGPRHNIKVCR